MGRQEPGKGWLGGQQGTEQACSAPPRSAYQLMPGMGLRPNTPHLPSAPILAKKEAPNPKPSKQKPKQLHENKVNTRN